MPTHFGKHRRRFVCNIDNICQVLGSMFWGPFLPKNICMYIIHIYTQHNQDFLFFHILMLPSLLTNKTITYVHCFYREKIHFFMSQLVHLDMWRIKHFTQQCVCKRHSLHFIQLLIFWFACACRIISLRFKYSTNKWSSFA